MYLLCFQVEIWLYADTMTKMKTSHSGRHLLMMVGHLIWTLRHPTGCHCLNRRRRDNVSGKKVITIKMTHG
jgi:hypothetical protein